MNERSTTCKGCLWRDDCDYDSPCDHYYYPEADDDDEAILWFIEKQREQFRKEWNRYIEYAEDFS